MAADAEEISRLQSRLDELKVNRSEIEEEISRLESAIDAAVATRQVTVKKHPRRRQIPIAELKSISNPLSR